MRRLFPLILLAIFATCTAQMCAKEETPTIQFDPQIQGSEDNSYTLYAPELDAERTLMFSILYQDESTTVTAMVEGAEAKVRMEGSAGSRKAVVTLKATAAFGESTDLVMTATNGHGTTTKTFALERAKMSVAKTTYDAVPCKGAILVLGLDSNLETDLCVRESDTEMLSIGMTSDKQLCLVVNENGMTARTGVMTIADVDGVLPEITVNVNQLGSGIPDVLNAETDKIALRAIYEALNRYDMIEKIDWSQPLTRATFDGDLSNGRIYARSFRYEDSGVLPDEFGWLDKIVDVDIVNRKITGTLPKTLGGCKSLRVLELYGSNICEKLEDSSLRDVISHLSKLSISTEFYGSFPEWFANLPSTSTLISTIFGTHLSGRIPDRVANMEAMKRRDGGRFAHVIDAYITSTRNYYNYALWVGEQPANVKFVNDEHGGHWEWTDTIFDEETKRWKREGDIRADDLWLDPNLDSEYLDELRNM